MGTCRRRRGRGHRIAARAAYMLLDWGTFFSHVSEQSEMIRGIRDYPYTRQYADTTPYWYHIRQLAVWGYGLPLGIAAWAGLLYVSLRGMPLKLGAAYLVVGWALPAAILLVSHSAIAVVAAAGISLLALLATLPVRSKDTRLDVLLLCWVVPYFIVTGAFHVKFMRYMLPIAPLLTLFGARMLWALWDSAHQTVIPAHTTVIPAHPTVIPAHPIVIPAKAGIQHDDERAELAQRGRMANVVRHAALRPFAAILIALVLVSTAFYALAYANGVYGSLHPAVRASEWLNRVAPYGAFILKEHWEESLPRLRSISSSTTCRCTRTTVSPRPRSSRKCLPTPTISCSSATGYTARYRACRERYPVSTAYYRLMFSKQLGYTQMDVQTSYPSLFGVALVDDTLGRPDLPSVGNWVGGYYSPTLDSPPLSVNLGYADESFSVYDHPKVLIYRNTGRLDAAEILRRIEEEAPSDESLSTRSEPELGLVYSPQDAAIQQSGGTWTDIIHPASWTNRLPVLAWLAALQLIALVTLPLTFVVFRPLSDRGYLLGKTLGILPRRAGRLASGKPAMVRVLPRFHRACHCANGSRLAKHTRLQMERDCGFHQTVAGTRL